MNYTKFHWGDWNTAVRFLPVEQEGFYMRLLSVYYTTERPIPVEMSSACENVGAFTPEHCAAVEAVLRRFFTLQPDGWHQKRCDEEIASARIEESRGRPASAYMRFRAEVFARDGHACVYCGCSSDRLELDHVVPRSRGGEDSPANLATACGPCNRSKGARTPEEWGRA